MSNCARGIVGKEDATEKILVSFLCGGHVLLEDKPGTGKTMLLRAFARTVGGDFKRVQFTPDLLPSDLTGIIFYIQKSCEFEFRPGPLFTNFVLADEINRATPRTQSALLEAMEEKQITVDGVTRRLAEPFMVLATQNPLESFGTFPLPDAQMDRFFMRLSLGYMNREQEMEVRSRPSAQAVLSQLNPVVTPEETVYVRTAYREVKVSEDVKNYLKDIVEATRMQGGYVSGVSTRGALALYQAAQAFFNGPIHQMVDAAAVVNDVIVPLFVAAHVFETHEERQIDFVDVAVDEAIGIVGGGEVFPEFTVIHDNLND